MHFRHVQLNKNPCTVSQWPQPTFRLSLLEDLKMEQSLRQGVVGKSIPVLNFARRHAVRLSGVRARPHECHDTQRVCSDAKRHFSDPAVGMSKFLATVHHLLQIHNVCLKSLYYRTDICHFSSRLISHFSSTSFYRWSAANKASIRVQWFVLLMHFAPSAASSKSP